MFCRQRPPVPVSSMPIYPTNPMNGSKHAYATPNGDAIDEFLVNSNRNAALPIASGQRIVSDHRVSPNLVMGNCQRRHSR